MQHPMLNLRNQMASTTIVTKSLFFLCLSLFFLITYGESSSNFIKTTSGRKARQMMKSKVSHLHFYFHDVVGGSNATAVPVTKAPNPTGSSFFGVIVMMDDLLTEGPDPKSKPVGHAQGMYAFADQEEIGFLMAMNLYFTDTDGIYNGSVLSVLGRNAPMHPVREMPVVGGSGMFRFATGYALARTHSFDAKTGDAIVEYNVTVMHY